MMHPIVHRVCKVCRGYQRMSLAVCALSVLSMIWIACDVGSQMLSSRMQFATTEIEDLEAKKLALTPIQEWPGGGTNLDTRLINNWAPTGLQTTSFIVTRGADNEGTTITGIDTTGIQPGDVRFFVNLPTGASPPTDSGTLTFRHEHTGSLAANRIQTPHGIDCTVPMYSVVGLIYGGLDGAVDGSGNPAGVNRWRIIGDCGWGQNALAQHLQFYPMCTTDPGALVSGTHNNYRPTCYTPFAAGLGLAGSTTDSYEHTVLRVNTDAAGATLTGLYTTGSQSDTRAHGPTKIIQNIGTGTLTLKNLNAGSNVECRFTLPRGQDLVLGPGESAWLHSPFNTGVDLSSGWQVIATGRSNETFPSVTTTGRTTTQTLSLRPILSPAALAAGLTSDYNPGSNTVIRVATSSPASYIDGLVPADALNGDEIRIIKNVGAYPLILVDDLYSVSTGANRFSIPRPGMAGATTTVASMHTVASGGQVALQYDSTSARWRLWGNGSEIGQFNTSSNITPAALPAANVNDYAPTDATSGLSGRFAYIWIIQGAVGTNITGIDATPGGSIPPFVVGDRIMLINAGSGLTIKNFSASSSAGNKFRLQADIVLNANGTIEFIYLGDVWVPTNRP